MTESNRERFLYIVGTSFTGSTLLAFLLNLHPQIVSVGECDPNFRNAPDPNEYPCSCGATLADCPFWTSVGVEMARSGMRFDPDHWGVNFGRADRLGHVPLAGDRVNGLSRALLLRTPILGKHVRSVARRNEAVVASARSVTGRPVFADASKSVSRVRLLDRTTDLSPYVVHLVRDSLGFVASKKSRADKNPEGADIGNATSYWNRRSAQAERLFWELPADRRVRVRYEDLCSDPERELERICELVELQPLPGPYEFLSGEHHILGNRMRLSSSSEIVPDERWRTVLTEEEAEDVRRLTRRHRQTFGYA